MSDYIFFIQLEIAAELEAKFNEIYDTDHLPCMVQIPGVRDATRYKLEWSDNADMQRYLALYHIDDPDLPRSDLWKKHGAMGRWPTEMRAHATMRRNGALRRIFHADAPSTGVKTPDSIDSDHIYFLQQSIPAALDTKFNELYNGDHIPLMLQAPGVKSATRYKLIYSDTGDVPDYLAIYAVDAADTPRSPEWRQQTNLGAWPTEMRPHFTARRNGAYRRLGIFTK
jgi:hypothetical protein